MHDGPIGETPGGAEAGEHSARTGKGESQTDQLVALVESAEVELFHSQVADAEAYASVRIDNHRENYRIRSKPFRNWLARQFYLQYQKGACVQAIQNALMTIEGKALHDGPVHPVAVRLAEHNGNIYFDLGDENWQVVEVTPLGWSVKGDCEVRFIRPKGYQALPVPVPGGKLDELWALINVPDPDSRALLAAVLVAYLRPRGPYPILNVNGEKGSCKSTLCRFVRGLIDPNQAMLRAEPREVHDLMISAKNSCILAYDNLSHIPPWLSDAMCRLATGGGFATRELYSDDDEIIFDSMHPVIVNGIEDLATRSDLLDRTVTLTLPAVPDSQRRTEADLLRAYEEIRPRILGALLTAASTALARISRVKLKSIPRMADFAIWVVAAEPALGLEEGAFLAAYSDSRQATHDLAVDSSAIGPSISSIAQKYGSWRGTATQLLRELSSEEHSDEHMRRRRGWPASPTQLGGQLRRLAPDLRALGVQVTFAPRTGQKRVITIEQGAEPSSRSTPSPHGPDFIDQSNAGTGASAAVRDGSDGNDGSDDEIHPHSNATRNLPSDHMRHVEKWGETPSQPSLSSQGPDFNDEQAVREERAAIMEEYDGELPNEEAEAQEEVEP
jgi:cytochrome c551/c552